MLPGFRPGAPGGAREMVGIVEMVENGENALNGGKCFKWWKMVKTTSFP